MQGYTKYGMQRMWNCNMQRMWNCTALLMQNVQYIPGPDDLSLGISFPLVSLKILSLSSLNTLLELLTLTKMEDDEIIFRGPPNMWKTLTFTFVVELFLKIWKI